jgi:glycosyltransferase involved in cell wall biosynthesis
MRDNVRLHILGDTDDEEYAQECYDLKEFLHLDGLIFAGHVDVTEYMKKIDFTVLTSISEGQPLSVLESFAAGRPAVTTDVGCCRELIFGNEGDNFGPAGYVVAPMHREDLAKAMDNLCKSRKKREDMGRNGQERVKAFFRHEFMMDNYKQMYREVMQIGRNRI